jgi:hypothetical protein
MMSARQALALLGIAAAIVCARPALAVGCSASQKIPEVRAELNAQGVRVGDPVQVRWSSKGQRDKDCTRPLFLVFAVSGRVRFSGSGFVAAPPGANGPYDIADHLNETRVFIPLHALPPTASGSFRVRFFTAGQNNVRWFVSSLSQDFRDIAERTATTLIEAQSSMRIEVGVGKPTIVVRDSFAPNIATGSGSIEHPSKKLISNSGEFELQVFDKFYRVYDTASGELVLERAGVQPNFSPTSRFIGAFTDGAGFEIVDLYADHVVVTGGQLNRSGKYVGPVDVAAWGRQDGLIALSIWGWGGIYIQQALVDGEGAGDGYGDCHACHGIDRPLHVDYDSGIAEFGGWASLFDASVGSEVAKAEAEKKYPLSDADRDGQRRDEYESTLNERMRTRTEARFLYSQQRTEPRSPRTDRASWYLGEEARFSHVCVPNSEGFCDPAEQAREPAILRKNLVEHSSSSERPISEAKAADFRLIASRSAVAKGGSGSTSSAVAWLRQLGTPVNEESQRKIPVEIWRDDQSERQPDAPEPVQQDLSAIESIIAKPEDMQRSAIPNFVNYRREVTKIPLSKVTRVATWSLDRTQFWLLHSDIHLGNSSDKSDQYLQLVSRTASGSIRVIDLSTRLLNNGVLGTNLGKVDISRHAWPWDFDFVTVADDRYLLLSGHWFLDQSRWALVYDLKANKALFFKPHLPNAANITSLNLTENQKHLVVTSRTGALYFYNIGSGAQVLTGQYIDDELVVFDQHGYYAATYEGSQFVFLKFAALPGYFPFKQFQAVLHRPDIIRRIYEGGEAPPSPPLVVPPQLAMEAMQGGAAGQLKVKIAAYSATGLDKLKLYVDGRHLEDRPLAGSRFQAEAPIALPPQARWLTAVAVDKAGNLSVPQAAAVPSDGRNSDRILHVVSVGTDSYRNLPPHLQLEFAVSDARSFASTLQNQHSGYYGRVMATTFFNATSLRTELPEALQSLRARTQAKDTVILFVSGHGYRGEDKKLYLVLTDSDPSRIEETSLAWDTVAQAFKGISARILVFIDACHSGAVPNGGSNDEIATTLAAHELNFTVLAAAKGRQESFERSDLGAGIFTHTILKAITQDRTSVDTNKNGVIELSELYSRIKPQVLTEMQGAQTPWLARIDVLGEVPLF